MSGVDEHGRERTFDEQPETQRHVEHDLRPAVAAAVALPERAEPDRRADRARRPTVAACPI